MYLLFLGLALLLMKYFAFGVVAQWSWWVVLAPFGLAVIWWAWADSSGYTGRKAMKKMEQVKAQRLKKSREAMGLKSKKN